MRLRKAARSCAALLLAAYVGLTATATAVAQTREPLKLEGKQTLFQRVLTRPGAAVAEAPGEPGEPGEPVPTFSRYYVYAEKEQDGERWLEVGPDSRGTVSGWLPTDKSVPWKQQMVLSFASPVGRAPILFFKDRATIEGIYTGFNAGEDYAKILSSVESKGFDPRVLSREPDTPVAIEEKFYLLPILSADEIYSAAGPTVRLLEVASVSDRNANELTAESATTPNDQAALRSFNAAIVFVIDSTISMGPYIERTKEAAQRIYEQIREQNLADRVTFGLFAYRSSTEAAPGLDYVSRAYVDPSTVKGGKDFLEKVEQLKPASVSSKAFDEDAYAGVMAAIDGVEWTDFGGRYVILITDAGALDPESGLGATGLTAEEVRAELAHRGIALYALHLKTEAGERNHASAQAQYRLLASNDASSQPLYYGVEAGSVKQFGAVVDTLGKSLAKHVGDAYRGKTVAGSAKMADPSFGRRELDDPVDRAAQDAELIGYAMALRYLGQQQGSKAPDVFRAWIADRDAANPRRPTTEVRVLLTKNQLSDLQEVVSIVADAALEGLINPDEMFSQLRSAAATLGRDPNQLSEDKSTKLVELGLFGEYLDGLPPYPSSILSLTENQWQASSGPEQDKIIRQLNSKLRLYERYNSDTDRWISLAEGADPSEDVYPVPLSTLP